MTDIVIDGVPITFVAFEGTPKIPKRVRVKTPGSRPGQKKALGNRDYTKQPSRENERIPGSHDYFCLRKTQIVSQFFNHPGFPSNSRAGVPDGMTKAQANEIWDRAREQARKDMEIIKTVFPTTDAIVEEATMMLLTNLRGPTDDSIKLSSAKVLLEFYKEKPKSKRDVTVNTFESWVESLEDKSGDDK